MYVDVKQRVVAEARLVKALSVWDLDWYVRENVRSHQDLAATPHY